MTQPKPKDHTGCLIVGIMLGVCGLGLFGLALDALKFFALVKWVFG